MDRRKFLQGAMYFTVASASMTLTACGGSDSSGSASPRNAFTFPSGVASGDPKDTSVVFWTRCNRTALDTGSGSGSISLRLEVSPTSTFDALIASVTLSASSTYDYTTRAKVTGLAPNTRYYYRFISGLDISPVGETKTAPAVGTTNDQVKFAWMTCQDWSVNHWGAMELLVQEDLDFVVHMGDYIYETVGASFQSAASEPAHGQITLPDGLPLPNGGFYANTLNDYRTLYKTYRGDSRLQEVHRKFPMVPIWDDHEFADDGWQDHQTYTNENKQETSRRRNANQAWVENMPVDFGDVSFDLNKAGIENIKIYRDFRFGSLVHLIMTDQRLYRDDHVVTEAFLASLLGSDPVNGVDNVGSRYFVPKTILNAAEATAATALQRTPSILGVTQTQWWKDTLNASTATWKLWGNEVTLNRMQVDLRTQAPPPFNQIYLASADGWDGFPTHRAELMGYLKDRNIQNVMALTGDLHAFQCGVIRDNADPATGTPVAVDFVIGSISSSSFYSYLRDQAPAALAPLVATPQILDGLLLANNPDFRYLDNDAQGYAVATVTAGAFTVLFNKVKPLNADGSKPSAPLLKRTRITVPVGTNAPVVEDNI
jgi:alkaline phosphatase D